MARSNRKGLLIPLALACLLGGSAVWAASAPAAAAARIAATAKTSRPYAVTVSFALTSPFIPDGRSSIAKLEFRAVFAPVVFEFDPEGDPLLGRCQLDTGKVKGVFTKFVLNDIQNGEDRQTPVFLTPRPAAFLAGIGIESEPTEDDEAAATSRTPPATIRLSFWTDFGAGEIKWGSTLGTGVLENLKAVFEAPFGDLMAGRARTITFPYEGKYPEDNGTWKIEFTPGIKKNG
jgi:hypothetical protein